MSRQTSSLFSAALIGPALIGSVRKLDPRAMIRNPVMFVVEVVAVLTTILFAPDRSKEDPSALQSLRPRSLSVFCLKKKTINKHS
ncbi:hypothetical protein, partial [Methylobacterium radiotolerans]|uniref:hypothetical protein n=1 Tax=Methylobacterium radiotolerans TaxID=31998 RepID=UPI000B9241BA